MNSSSIEAHRHRHRSTELRETQAKRQKGSVEQLEYTRSWIEHLSAPSSRLLLAEVYSSLHKHLCALHLRLSSVRYELHLLVLDTEAWFGIASLRTGLGTLE